MIDLFDQKTASRQLFGNLTASQARRAIEESPLFRGRSNLIHIEEHEGRLILEGRLPSFYLKQMLQTLLQDVEGVQQIENRVAVDSPVVAKSDLWS